MHSGLEPCILEIWGITTSRSKWTSTGLRQANGELRRFEKETALEGEPGEPPFSKATPEDLKAYVADLDEMIAAFTRLGAACRILRGADAAILSGERDLGKIEKSEMQLMRQP